MKARHVEGLLSKYHDNQAEPGDIEFMKDQKGEYTSLNVVCPGCGSLQALPIKPGGVWWQWDGNLERPTLSPSILHYAHGKDQCWHGYLVEGEFVPC